MFGTPELEQVMFSAECVERSDDSNDLELSVILSTPAGPSSKLKLLAFFKYDPYGSLVSEVRSFA